MTLAIRADAARPTRPAKPRSAPLRVVKPVEPFTLAHFRAWASDLILDTGESWHPEPFQDAFLEDVFGGAAECWLVVPEGNGKTTLVAGLALYHAEFRQHASVPVAASSREQAEIMYRQAEGFVLRSERLCAPVHSQIQLAKGKRKTDVPRFTCLEGYRRINHFAGGRIQVFAADDRTGDGVIPTMGVLDELHRHRDLSLYRTWAGKLAKRGGQIVAISTAGEPGSDFEMTRELIRKRAEHVVRKGSFVRATSKRLVLHEWAVTEKAAPDDFKAVKAANPFSGITAPMLREKYASPTMTMAHWTRFVCNRPTRPQTSAVSEGEWNAAKTELEIPAGEGVYLGLDVAWKWDTTAAVPLWWRDAECRVLGPASIVVPPRDGNMTDPAAIKTAIAAIHARNPIHTVVMDISRASDLAAWLEGELGATVIEWPQSNTQAVKDYEAFMEALRSGWLKHQGDAGLTAHVLNAVARVLPFGDTRFDRVTRTRETDRQDQLVIDALSAASFVHSFAAGAMTAPPAAAPEFVVL